MRTCIGECIPINAIAKGSAFKLARGEYILHALSNLRSAKLSIQYVEKMHSRKLKVVLGQIVET